jgi:hypothetical protein
VGPGSDGRTERACAEVIIEAGGDHQFDLGHVRREGAERLVRLLLHTAGYRKPLQWGVRVEKKIGCGPETRPVTVVGAKPWCCYLKIKPGDNDTAHFCSLLMPDGCRSEAVFDALKEAEGRVNCAWRNGFEGEVAPVEDGPGPGETNGVARGGTVREAGRRPLAPRREEVGEVQAAPPADAAAAAGGGEEPGTSELLGWSQDPERVRLALFAIHEVGREGKATTLDEFVTSLADKLGWQGLRRKQIGGVFTALVRRGHIVRLRRGALSLGYALTPEGERLIHDLLPADGPSTPPAAEAAPAVPAVPDAAGLAAALTEAAQGYAAAHQKLQANRARRAELAAEIARPDEEASALARVVGNPEVQGLLERLLQLTGAAGRPCASSAPTPGGAGSERQPGAPSTLG